MLILQPRSQDFFPFFGNSTKTYLVKFHRESQTFPIYVAEEQWQSNVPASSSVSSINKIAGTRTSSENSPCRCNLFPQKWFWHRPFKAKERITKLQDSLVPSRPWWEIKCDVTRWAQRKDSPPQASHCHSIRAYRTGDEAASRLHYRFTAGPTHSFGVGQTDSTVLYTLFQNGGKYIILLSPCQLALVALF